MRLVFKVFLLCFIVGIFSTVAVAEDNLYWTGGSGTSSVSDVNNWIDDGGNHPVDLTTDHRCWINMDLGNTPIITAADPYPGSFWDLNIGLSSQGGAGTVLQTGGTTNVNYNLNIGGGSIAGDPVSSLTMTGGTLNAGNEIYVGYEGGAGSLIIDNATITNGASPMDGGSGWTQIGRGGGGAGTLTMTGASLLSIGEEFRAGWMGGNSTVDLSGTSRIVARGFQNMGRDTDSVLNVNMTGSSKMSCTYNEMRFGSNGGEAHLVMDGDNAADPVGIGNFEPGGDCWFVNFGEDSGSLATLEMHNYSTIQTGYDASFGVNGGVAAVTMDGSAKIQASFIHFAEGGGSSATLDLDGSAQLYSTGEIRLGAGGAMTTTMSGSSNIHADGNLHIGLWGGSSNVTMNAGTSMYAGNEFHINSFGAGNSSLTMDGASLTVNSGEMFVGWNDGANGTLSMNESTVTTHNNVQVGRLGSGTLNMTGNSYFYTDGDFRLGIDNGTGTLNMSGTSVIDCFSLGWIAAHPGWDSDYAGTAYVNITGSAKLMSHYNEASFGSGGGHAEVYMNGTDPGNPAAISCGYYSDGYWVSFGRDGGSSATLEMRGNSVVVSSAFTEMGVYGASCSTHMYDDARIYDNGNYGADFNAGSYSPSSYAEIHMYNNASISTVGKMEFGQQGYCMIELNDASTLHANSWMGVGRDGGTAYITVNGGTVETSDLQIAYEGTGVVTVGGGSNPALLRSNNGIELGWENDDSPNTQATLTIAAGGTVETQYVRSAKNGSAGPLSSILNFNGGVLKATAGSTTFVSNTAGSSLFQLNVLEGGAIVDTAGNDDTVTEALLHAAGANPDGGLTKLGLGKLTLTADSTYTGTTLVQAGALSVTGSITSDVVVAAGATLGGSGSVQSVTGGADAILQPDDPATLSVLGDLTWGGTLSVLYDGIDAQPVSLVDVAGDVTLDDATFDFVQIGDDLSGGPYVFLSYAGTLIGSATANHVPSGYTVQYDPGAVSLVPVPEPSTLVLLALGLLGFASLLHGRK